MEGSSIFLAVAGALLLIGPGCGSGISADKRRSVGAEELERVPKAGPDESIVGFDAISDSSGDLHLVWKNAEDVFLYTRRGESLAWITPRPLGGGGRLPQLITTEESTHFFFSSGSQVFRIPVVSVGNPKRQQVVQAKWFISSFSICSDGRDIFLACVAPAAEKKAVLYRFDPELNKVVRQEVFDLPGGNSLRDPEVASCFEAGRVHLILRYGDSSLAYTFLDLQTLKPSAWMQVQTTFAPEVSRDFRQAGVGLILDGTLAVNPIAGNLVVSFTSSGPMLMVRDKAGQWSGVSMLAPAGAGRADGRSVSVAPNSSGWCVAWIDARHQEKSFKFGIPWSDDNPYWGNNDIYSIQIPAPGNASEFTASLAKARQLRVTPPLGFARSLKLLPYVNSSQVELFWLGTDRVAKATQSGVKPFHGIFHKTLQL